MRSPSILRASGVSVMPLASFGRSERAAISCARAATASFHFEFGTTSSTSRHSTALAPRMPSSIEQNTSARSRRTLRLSVTRVSPPVPGSTAKQRRLRQRHRRAAVVHQHDVIGGERQFIAAAGGVAVDGADVGLLGILRGILDGQPRFVGELAEVHLVAVRRLAEHADIGAGAEHIVLARLDDDRSALPDARSAGAARRRSIRCRRRGRRSSASARSPRTSRRPDRHP